jgi:ATP-dependent Clp protease ATP-binding subunit ClpA
VTEAIVAGAIAGAVAGAVVALVVAVTMRRRDGGWRAYTARSGPSRQWQGRAESVHMSHAYTADSPSVPLRYSSFSFDALDDSGKRVLAIAQDEAIRMNHNYIGTEHLLLGLLRGDADGPAGRALTRLGVTLDKARTAARFIIGQGDAPTSPSEITLSPRTRKVLELAMDEARKLGHAKAGAAEICLGLIREGQGIASGIIESLGVTLDAARNAVIGELAGQPAPPPARPDPRPAQTPGSREREGSYQGPFDRFNDRAKRVLALAQDEAIRFNHNYIGPEHLLLGLVREGEGVAARVLTGLNVDLARTRREVESLIGRGDATTSPSEIALIPRTKKIIELAIDEARQLGHSHVGTEHLLLGLVREPGSNAGAILKAQGVDLETVRQKVIASFSGEPGAGPSS